MIEQGSPEWFAIRCGKVTASRIADVIAKTKSGYSASRATYMGQLIAERLTGSVVDSYKSEAMQWGTEHEAEARAVYEMFTGCRIAQIGFVIHPAYPMSGASPDGFVGTDGLVEIKCPNTATHIETLLGGTIPRKYVSQMMWQMACTDRKWCDFVSYDPRMPDHMRLFVQRLEFDSDKADEIEVEVREFLKELEDKVAALRAAYPDPMAIAAE